MTNDVAASGAEPGAAIFVSVFFIKIGFVAVGTEQDVRHPVRRSLYSHQIMLQGFLPEWYRRRQGHIL